MSINPAGSVAYDVNRIDLDQFVGSGQLEATFLNDFKFTVGVAYNYYDQVRNATFNPYYGDGQAANGRLEKYTTTYRDVTGNQILSWSHTYNGVHHVSAFVGHESYWSETAYSCGKKYNFVQDKVTDYGNAVAYSSLTGYTYGYALDSYFGQVSYDYAEKYFVNASVRADGSSRFAKGHRWGTFGSVGAAWNITKEAFMQDVPFVRNLKLKASWGLIGNQGLFGNQSFSSDDLGLSAYYPYNTIYTIGNLNNQPSFTLKLKGNKNLSWEKTSSFNVGIEFDLGGIVEGEIDYFNKLTYDMLFMKSVAPSQGYSSYPVNDGKLRNSGFEISLVTHVVRTEDVDLDIRFNAAHYDNKIVEMPIDDGTGKPQYYYSVADYYAWQKGHSVYDFYLCEYAGVDPETGYALYNMYTATFADGTTTDITDMELFKSQNQGAEYTISKTTTTNASKATEKYVGESAIPTILGGFGFDLRWKDITLGATFAYSLGGKAYDYYYQRLMSDHGAGTMNWHKDIERRWQKPGDITDVPMLSNDSKAGTYANYTSTRFLTSRSYLTLSSIRLAWSVPEAWTRAWAGMYGVQIYASGENLFLISARRGFMPGTSLSGLSSDSQYLPSSNFTVGLKLNF